MLTRGDSDFQWFKKRTESIHSPLTSSYSNMAASSVPLNAETSHPLERAEHSLAPKSYADAVADSTTGLAGGSKDTSSSKVNGLLESDASSSVPLNTEISQPPEPAEHSLASKSYADAVADSGTDLAGNSKDEPSSKINGLLEGDTSSSATAGNTNGFPPANGVRKPVGEDKVVYEKYVNDKGEHLMSVKPDDTYERSLEHDVLNAPRENQRKDKTVRIMKRQNGKSQLASGRRAGAGWERSA